MAGLAGSGLTDARSRDRAGAAEAADIRDREAFNEVYARYFTEGRFPARSAIGTSGLYGGARVELSCTAVVR